MPIDVATLADLMRPLFATHNPFIEARRLGVVLMPVIGSQGRYMRRLPPHDSLLSVRPATEEHGRGYIEYDPSKPRAEQAYTIARAVLHCVLSEAGELRELSPHVSLRELAERLFSANPCVRDALLPTRG